MSVNWVMLSPNGEFVRLPSEQKLFTSKKRVSIALSGLNHSHGLAPYNLSSDSGVVYLTNRRVIYLPATPPRTTSNQTPPTVLASFAAPLTHLHDSHVTSPWIGPNVWVAMVQPVLGGGIPSHHVAIEIRLTFKEGGAYDFHEHFCRLRERLAQIQEMGSDVQNGQGRRANGVADGDVNLEQLPAYEERDSRAAPPPPPAATTTTAAVNGLRPPGAQAASVTLEPLPAYERREGGGASSSSAQQGSSGASQAAQKEEEKETEDLMEFDNDEQPSQSSTQNQTQATQSTHGRSASGVPADPPPGYEEAQRDSVADMLERNLSINDR